MGCKPKSKGEQPKVKGPTNPVSKASEEDRSKKVTSSKPTSKGSKKNK
jgi:hypothetical protein